MVSKLKSVCESIIVFGGMSFLSAMCLYSPTGRVMSGSLEGNLFKAEKYYSELTNQITQFYCEPPYNSKRLEDQFGATSEKQEELIDLLVQKSKAVEEDIAEMKSEINSRPYKEKTKSRDRLFDGLVKYGLLAMGVGVAGKIFVRSRAPKKVNYVPRSENNCGV